VPGTEANHSDYIVHAAMDTALVSRLRIQLAACDGQKERAHVWHGPFKTTQQEEMRLQLARRLCAIQGY